MSYQIHCPSCAVLFTVSGSGRFNCPHCSQPVDIAHSVARPFPFFKSLKVVCGILIAGFVLLVLLGSLVGTTEQRDLIDIKTASMDAVSGKLKAPSTAKFPEFSDRDGFKIYDIKRNTASECVAVTGWVDSQNGFGAMIRTRWRVEMRRDATQVWVIDKVMVDNDP